MKKKLIIVSAVLLTVLIVWFLLGKNSPAGKTNQYEYAETKIGTIENIITGTGSLSPVSTVEVGTRVSGTIDKIYTDFNEYVKKGQVLAVLDTTLLSASVREAEANLLQAQVQYRQSQIDFKRAEELYKKDFIKETEFEQSKTDMEIKKSAVLKAEVNLEKMERNLDFAIIKSPINGTVIQRNVEVGQTVAASFSAPVLFIIAEDLAKMEILGLVDESDIGMIKVGQNVRFTVEAYFEKTFFGTVQQIRLQPETISNVVTYTVVIDTDNEEGLLYPGMTATIDFITEKKEDILVIENKALRFAPPEDLLAAYREKRQKEREKRMNEMSEEERQKMAERAERFRNSGNGTQNNDIAVLWYFDTNNELTSQPVKKGSTDGSFTELLPLSRPGRGGANQKLEAGMKFLSDVKEEEIEERTRTGLFTPMGRRH